MEELTSWRSHAYIILSRGAQRGSLSRHAFLGGNEVTVARPSISVGVRLPLPTGKLPPAQLLEVCRVALELGYTSFWVGDHVLLPECSASAYPHTEDGSRPFRADTPWADPLLELTWLAAQLPGARFGTSVLILTLRKPSLLA